MATWAEKLSCRQNEVSKRVVFEIKLLFLDWLKEVCQSRRCQELIVEPFWEISLLWVILVTYWSTVGGC
jgi:hypothetical protein